MSPPATNNLNITLLEQLPSYPNSDNLGEIAKSEDWKLFNGVERHMWWKKYLKEKILKRHWER